MPIIKLSLLKVHFHSIKSTNVKIYRDIFELDSRKPIIELVVVLKRNKVLLVF